MSLFKNLLGKKDSKISSYTDFWAWFQSKERDFFKVVKSRGDFERDFFAVLSPKLNELREGYFYLVGMLDDNTADMVFSAEGKIKNFVFVEELVQAAPPMPGWKFTAHKPALDIENVNIDMSGYQFNSSNLSFMPVDNAAYPDEIEITVVHADLSDNNRDEIVNGIYIFLDNYLGEINFATTIDYLNVEKKNDQQNLIPIDKLKDYLIWRQKEFVEKYEGVRHSTENDHYAGMEATLENGNPMIATINTDLLKWDRKMSHPWILKIEIRYNDSGNGMPDEDTYELMGLFEEEMNNELKDSDGYLNVGRETADAVREIYFACKDFRVSSKITSDIVQRFADRTEISYDIYKDKYWRTFDRYGVV